MGWKSWRDDAMLYLLVGIPGWLYLSESRPLDSEGSLVSLGFWPGWIAGWGQEGWG